MILSRSQFTPARRNSFGYGACLVANVAVVIGCQQGPPPLPLPDFDPSEAGARAIELYDTDRDGKIAGEELALAPSLKSSLERFDTDGDRAISSDEIQARLQSLLDQKLGYLPVRVQVTLDGDPLEGVEVVFEPEEFLDGTVERASGTTSVDGETQMAILEENWPTEDFGIGMQPGFYKVRVSSKAGGSERLPAKYNERTELGEELSRDSRVSHRGYVQFDLKSN